MISKGRPPVSKKLKKVNFGFTAAPELRLKLKKIKRAKSNFIGAVLEAVSDDLIAQYNAYPEQFFLDLKKASLKPDLT